MLRQWRDAEEITSGLPEPVIDFKGMGGTANVVKPRFPCEKNCGAERVTDLRPAAPVKPSMLSYRNFPTQPCCIADPTLSSLPNQVPCGSLPC